MKKVFALFFLSAYLISTTELSQLLKFPVLVVHYFEHKEKNSEMSVLDFLALHYVGNHPHDDQDQKLPFIAHTDVLSFCFVYTSPSSFDIKPKFFVNQESKVLPFNDTFLYKNFFSSIWQPPRFG